MDIDAPPPNYVPQHAGSSDYDSLSETEGNLEELLNDIVQMEPLSAPLQSISNKVIQFRFDDESDADVNIDEEGLGNLTDHEAAFRVFRDHVKEATGLGKVRRKHESPKKGHRPLKLSIELKQLLGTANMYYVTQQFTPAIAAFQE
ncbi:hypothetical protein BJ085DRAFT_27240, partial [Dimargaris cristalligena]